jgi:hypothetical protein
MTWLVDPEKLDQLLAGVDRAQASITEIVSNQRAIAAALGSSAVSLSGISVLLQGLATDQTTVIGTDVAQIIDRLRALKAALGNLPTAASNQAIIARLTNLIK